MTFPHRLQFVLLLICCMQDVLASTSSINDTTNSSSTYVKITSTTVTPSSSVFTVPHVNFSIGTGYSSPDCTSCSNGGTITVTKSCSISKDTKCDMEGLTKTSCGYVTMVNKTYSCADVKNNFTAYEEKYLESEKKCDEVCPASGSVLSAHLEFIFSSGLAFGILLQTL